MRLWIHNKKPGVTVTERDSHAEIPLIPTLQKLGLPRLMPIVRIRVEGVILCFIHAEFCDRGGLTSTLRDYCCCAFRYVGLSEPRCSTNHGELKQALERSTLKRKYRVRVRGSIPGQLIEELAQGVTVEGVHYAPIELHVPNRSEVTGNQWVDITLQEGKNRCECLPLAWVSESNVQGDPAHHAALRAADLTSHSRAICIVHTRRPRGGCYSGSGD